MERGEEGSIKGILSQKKQTCYIHLETHFVHLLDMSYLQKLVGVNNLAGGLDF